MRNLESIVQEFDQKCQEIVRQLMDAEFMEYKDEIKWEKILVYKDYEEIVTKMLCKGCTWYFGKVASKAVNSKYRCKSIRMAVIEDESEGKTETKVKFGKLKNPKNDETQKVDKMVLIFLKKEEKKEIMK